MLGAALAGGGLGALGGYLSQRASRKSAKKERKEAEKASKQTRLLEYLSNIVKVYGGQEMENMSGVKPLPIVPEMDYGAMIQNGMQGAGAGMSLARSGQEGTGGAGQPTVPDYFKKRNASNGSSAPSFY